MPPSLFSHDLSPKISMKGAYCALWQRALPNSRHMLLVIAELKAHATLPVLLGSGIAVGNIEDFFTADAVIVGSSFKEGNTWSGALNTVQVRTFIEKVRLLRQTAQAP